MRSHLLRRVGAAMVVPARRTRVTKCFKCCGLMCVVRAFAGSGGLSNARNDSRPLTCAWPRTYSPAGCLGRLVRELLHPGIGRRESLVGVQLRKAASGLPAHGSLAARLSRSPPAGAASHLGRVAVPRTDPATGESCPPSPARHAAWQLSSLLPRILRPRRREVWSTSTGPANRPGGGGSQLLDGWRCARWPGRLPRR